MGIEQKLRHLQDLGNNFGWRIQWIPWQGQGRVEKVYNTWLSLMTGLGGAVLFLVSCFLVLTQRAHVSVLGVGVLGLMVAVLGRLYAARYRQAAWIKVAARCDDIEIRKARLPHQGAKLRYVWVFRLLCRFNHEGQEFTVTPMSSRAGFESEDAANTYLHERIAEDGSCTLWINPDNPFESVFDKKMVI